MTSHGGVGLRFLPLGRRSPTNYMFNHIGGHAYQQGELCRSIVFGGVPARFPNLAFGFLECGAGWAVDLLHSLEEHWEKRNVERLKNYDPARLDRARLFALLKEYGGPEYIASSGERLGRAYDEGVARHDRDADRDEWSRCGVREEHDFARIFENFFFGCEADDPSVHRALDARANPFKLRFQPIFSTTSVTGTFPTSSACCSKVIISRTRGSSATPTIAISFSPIPRDLHMKANPDFFKGTVVEGATFEPLLTSAPRLISR